jgi:hypothetical protein
MFQWNDHHQLAGKHALMGGSNYHWLNWTNDNFEDHFFSMFSTEMGTALHELASSCIKSGTRLNKGDRHIVDLTLYRAGIPASEFDTEAILQNLIPFVNDAIGFHMDSEVILYYSQYCFGTADAVSMDDKNRILRVHDYKSGSTTAHMEQLMIYAALFCLEYHRHPKNFVTKLRIYQNMEIVESVPDPSEIESIMNLIIERNARVLKIIERDTK